MLEKQGSKLNWMCNRDLNQNLTSNKRKDEIVKIESSNSYESTTLLLIHDNDDSTVEESRTRICFRRLISALIAFLFLLLTCIGVTYAVHTRNFFLAVVFVIASVSHAVCVSQGVCFHNKVETG